MKHHLLSVIFPDFFRADSRLSDRRPHFGIAGTWRWLVLDDLSGTKRRRGRVGRLILTDTPQGSNSEFEANASDPLGISECNVMTQLNQCVRPPGKHRTVSLGLFPLGLKTSDPHAAPAAYPSDRVRGCLIPSWIDAR